MHRKWLCSYRSDRCCSGAEVVWGGVGKLGRHCQYQSRSGRVDLRHSLHCQRVERAGTRGLTRPGFWTGSSERLRYDRRHGCLKIRPGRVTGVGCQLEPVASAYSTLSPPTERPKWAQTGQSLLCARTSASSIRSSKPGQQQSTQPGRGSSSIRRPRSGPSEGLRRVNSNLSDMSAIRRYSRH